MLQIDQFLCSEGRLFSSSTLGHLQTLIDYHNLILINKKPTRGNAILDLVIVKSPLSQSIVRQLLPIGSSDHLAQMINLQMVTVADLRHGKIKKIRFDLMFSLLSSIDWSIAFVGCTDIDSFTVVFMRGLNKTLAQSSSVFHKQYRKKESLPKHVIQLIQKKNAEWRKAQVVRDSKTYYLTRCQFRTAAFFMACRT